MAFFVFVFYLIWDRAKSKKIFHIIKGLMFLVALFSAATLFEFPSVALLLKYFIGLCLILILILSQPEIRKFLEAVGNTSFLSYFFGKEKNLAEKKDILEIVEACVQMSKDKTGGILVFEENSLIPEGERGTRLNAEISKNLILNLFFNKSPLHDGAIIIGDGKIKYAGCFLPMSEEKKDLGTRHNASIGATMQYDCFCITISEERGYISYVKNGEIQQNLKRDQLYDILEERLRKENKKQKEFPIKKLSISLLLGVCSWFLLANTTDPIISMKYANLPIAIRNESALGENVYSFSSKDKTSIVVTGKRSMLDKIQKEDLLPFVDIRKMSAGGSVPVEISRLEQYESSGISLSSSEKVSVLRTEEIVEKEIPVTYSIKSPGKDKYIKRVEVTPSLVKIKGAKSKIEIVDAASISFSLSQVKENMALPIALYDRNGTQMDMDDFSIDYPNIKTSVTLYPTKRVPIILNQPPKEKEEFVISVDPKEVLIAAEENILQKIEKIAIPFPLSEDEKNSFSGTLIKSVDLSKVVPSNIHFPEEKKASIEIRMAEKEEHLEN